MPDNFLACLLTVSFHRKSRYLTEGSCISEINSEYKGGWPGQADITGNLEELRESCHFRIHNNQIKYCWTYLYPCRPFEWFYSFRNIYQVPTVWFILPIHQGHVCVCVYLDVSVVVCRDRTRSCPRFLSCQFKIITFMMIARMSLWVWLLFLQKILGSAAAPSTHTHTRTLLSIQKMTQF